MTQVQNGAQEQEQGGSLAWLMAGQWADLHIYATSKFTEPKHSSEYCDATTEVKD
jgi:hypothetical protein